VSQDVEEQDTDAILRVCSYHRRDFDLVVVRSRPHEMQPVYASLQAPFETQATAQLGILGSLPQELMSLILHLLDLRSLFRFRQVNRQARIVSTSLWAYQLVSKHGLEGLRGFLRAGLAPCFTIYDIYRPLITDRCAVCGEFGGHLFLYTAERCCLKCLESSALYRVLSISTFTKLAHVSSSRLSRLETVCLRTVPGIYNMMETPARRPKYLILERKATQALVAEGFVTEYAARQLKARGEQPGQRFMAATAYPSCDLENAALERGVSCKGCQIRQEATHNAWDDRDRAFSSRGFLSHFKRCAEARRPWSQSEGGTRTVDEPEFTRRCGYFNVLGPDGLPA
jgi:hypothetical protein